MNFKNMARLYFFPQGKVLAKYTEHLIPNYLEKILGDKIFLRQTQNESGGSFYC